MPFHHNKPHSPPVFHGGPPRTAVRCDPDSYGDFVCPGPIAYECLCVPLKKGVSICPSLVELVHTKSTGLQCQMLQGLFLPVPDPQVWGLDMGLRILSPIGESLLYSYFSVCGASHSRGMGLLISHNSPCYLLMWPLLCLME